MKGYLMTGDFPDELPVALREVRTCPLFVMRLNVRPLQIVGERRASIAGSASCPAVHFQARACLATYLKAAMTGSPFAAMGVPRCAGFAARAQNHR
jgi:hypothetical protein